MSRALLIGDMQACSTKSPKLTVLALGAIQRLLSIEPVNPRFIGTVIGGVALMPQPR